MLHIIHIFVKLDFIPSSRQCGQPTSKALGDSDDDNDGVLTVQEGSGDRNGNHLPDYLEKEVVGAGEGMQRVFLAVVRR